MINIIEILKQHEVAPSIQRVKILEFLRDNHTHPTADMIYQALVEKMPTLSKTTVYNTLKTFVEKGILLSLSIFENEVRYEYNTESHIHFKCIECNKIYDLDSEFDHFENTFIEGNKVLEHYVNLKGICKECLKEEG